MNVTQLQVKRLLELRGAIREARHAVHGARPHVARALKLHKVASQKVNRMIGKFAALDETNAPDPTSPDFETVQTWQTAAAESFAELESAVDKLIARKRQSKAFGKPAFSKPDTVAGRRKLKAAKGKTKAGRRKALDEQIQSEKQKLGPLAHAAQQCIIAATDNTKARNSVATAVSFARDYAPNLMAPQITYVGEHSEECRNKLKAVQAQSRRIIDLMREREAIG